METGNLTVSPVNMEERKEIDIKPGDTVRVWQKVEEKGKIRLQPFEGVVLARKHGSEAGATFTVRRVTGGYAVEKIFPLYSPVIDKIEITKRAKVRRAKLYHIRDKAAREIKRQMRNMMFVDISTGSDIADKEQAETEATEEKEKQDEAKIEDPKAEAQEETTKEAEKVIEEKEKVEEKTEEEEVPSEEKSEDKKEE